MILIIDKSLVDEDRFAQFREQIHKPNQLDISNLLPAHLFFILALFLEEHFNRSLKPSHLHLAVQPTSITAHAVEHTGEILQLWHHLTLEGASPPPIIESVRAEFGQA